MRLLTFTLALILCVAPAGYAGTGGRQAAIEQVDGTVDVRIQQGRWEPAMSDMLLHQGDMIRTRENSTAVLALNGSGTTATINLEENSQLAITQLLENPAEASETTLLDLAMGKVLIHAKKLDTEKSRFEVKTPTSIVGVRGTIFSVAVEALE